MSLSSKGRVEILITNVHPDVKKDLLFIAKKIEGKTLSQLLRPKLREIINSYPERVMQGRDLEE